jgi:hypothetical protein
MDIAITILPNPVVASMLLAAKIAIPRIIQYSGMRIGPQKCIESQVKG